MALCGLYQQLGLKFTITLMDPVPVPSLVRKNNVMSLSVLQARAQNYDNRLLTKLREKVDSKEITNMWELDVEMLRLVDNDVEFAGLIRDTALSADLNSNFLVEIVSGEQKLDVLDTRGAVFVFFQRGRLLPLARGHAMEAKAKL